jgi:predicted kinase
VDSPPTLLLLTGPPGTGKSALAGAAADLLEAPVLGWDWAMAAMTGFATIQVALGSLPPVEHRRVGWSILWNLATAQLRRGVSVVLDGVARSVEVASTREVAQSEGARCLVVTTCCSNAGVHRQRVEGRDRAIPGWHELEWDHVAEVVARWEPPEDADLHLDAVDRLRTNVQRLTALVAQ